MQLKNQDRTYPNVNKAISNFLENTLQAGNEPQFVFNHRYTPTMKQQT